MKVTMIRLGVAALLAASTIGLAGLARPAVDSAAVETAREPEIFKIDTVHSSVIFKVKHMGVSWFYGRFNDISGEIGWNGDEPAGHSIKAEIKAASVDTNSADRDKHLRSNDFFDTANYPTISFVSKGAKKSGENRYEVSGDLTLHGVTKSITVMIEHVGTATARGKRIGVAAEFTIKRSDFGMTYGVDGPVGDEVTIFLGLEGLKADR